MLGDFNDEMTLKLSCDYEDKHCRDWLTACQCMLCPPNLTVMFESDVEVLEHQQRVHGRVKRAKCQS